MYQQKEIKMATKEMVEFGVGCLCCGETFPITAAPEDVINWQSGQLIQEAMPYLNPDERELLISKTCGSCFGEMFGENCDDWD